MGTQVMTRVGRSGCVHLCAVRWRLSGGRVILRGMPNGRNADPVVVAQKMARIRDPHVRPLNALADRVADSTGLPHGHIPYVDPDQGGIKARVLVLLDNPSTKAAAGTGSGLLSL